MAGSCREIVTLQFGHYANFVGTHWWNIQESSFAYNASDVSSNEINHDVLFREGRNLSGEVTYTPRLLLFDLKGSLNSLKQDGALYDIPDANDDLLWTSDVTMHKAEPGLKNDFLQDLERNEDEECDGETEDKETEDKEADLEKPTPHDLDPVIYGKRQHQLDNQVKVWSDFLRLHLHPKTIQVVQQYWHDSDSESFDVYNLGESVVTDHRTHDEIEDRLHFFLEECDNLQGLHILCDPNNGFGGMASKISEELSDEFPSKSIFVIPVHEPATPGKIQIETDVGLVSSVMSYRSLMEHASAVLPLSVAPCLFNPSFNNPFPHLSPKYDLSYHTAALLACGVESLSLPYRRSGHSCLLPHLTEALTPAGRKLLNLQMSLPFPTQSDVQFSKTLSGLGNRLPWQSMTPYCHSNLKVDGGQSVVFQGLDQLQFGKEESFDETFHEYLANKTGSHSSALCAMKQACKVTEPFPHLFNKDVTSIGKLSAVERSENIGVESVPLMSCLQSTLGGAAILNQIHKRASRLDLKRLHRCEKAGLEEDTFKDNVTGLQSICEEYID